MALRSRGPLPTLPNTITIDMTPNLHGQGWMGMTSVFHSQIQGARTAQPANPSLCPGEASLVGCGSAWLQLPDCSVAKCLMMTLLHK